MPKPTAIPVRCDDSLHRMPLAELQHFQRDLKTLSKADEDKLAASLRKHGFFVPLFVWRNWILDGHQRLLVLERRGWHLDGDVPVVRIAAKSKKDAAEKLLAITSTYGKIDASGLYEFVENFGVEFLSMDSVELPNLDVFSFRDTYYPNVEIPTQQHWADAFDDVAPRGDIEYKTITFSLKPGEMAKLVKCLSTFDETSKNVAIMEMVKACLS